MKRVFNIKKFLVFIFILLIICASSVVGVYFYLIGSPSNKSEQKIIYIDEGSSYSSIAPILKENGFEILYYNECFPTLKFYDLGSIAYFAKIIEWEFINFSVEKHFDKFLVLQDKLKEVGYITSTEHRFIIIAKKKEVK